MFCHDDGAEKFYIAISPSINIALHALDLHASVLDKDTDKNRQISVWALPY